MSEDFESQRTSASTGTTLPAEESLGAELFFLGSAEGFVAQVQDVELLVARP